MNQDKLLLRPITIDDLEFFLNIRNECRNNLHDNREFSLTEATHWFKNNLPRYYILELDRHKIGYFRTSHWDENNKHVSIGCDLHQDFRGRGLAKKGYVEFINYLFETYHFNKIYLEVLTTNQIAYNLYNKLGFVVEGIKRDEIYRDGTYIDSIMMSILHKEW